MSIFDLFSQIEKNSNSGNKKIEWIVAGLGNPGLQYENTRHNAGFMAMEILAEESNVKIDRMQFKGNCTESMLGETRCLLLKPTTFMNLSGDSVAQAASFYKIPADHVLIIYDDITQNPGDIRIRRKGSAGGHNGMKSIIAQLGTDEFPRIRIGVGAKPHKDYDLADWVLSRFTEADMEKLTPALKNAAEAARCIVSGNMDKAMNQFSH